MRRDRASRVRAHRHGTPKREGLPQIWWRPARGEPDLVWSIAQLGANRDNDLLR